MQDYFQAIRQGVFFKCNFAGLLRKGGGAYEHACREKEKPIFH
jgi:hypothetical protein